MSSVGTTRAIQIIRELQLSARVVNMSDVGKTPKSGLILLCVAFIATGIYLCVVGFSARGTGALIYGLSPRRAYEWFEVIFGGIVSIVTGVGGIWAVLRKQKEP